MVEKIEDLNLPNAIVQRLMKQALPDDTKIAIESKLALTRATSVFVLYLTNTATSIAKSKKTKTLTADHVLAALEEIEFEAFVSPLKEDLEIYRQSQKDKKDKSKADINGKDNETEQDGD